MGEAAFERRPSNTSREFALLRANATSAQLQLPGGLTPTNPQSVPYSWLRGDVIAGEHAHLRGHRFVVEDDVGVQVLFTWQTHLSVSPGSR